MLSHRITSTGLAVAAAAMLGVTPGAVASGGQDLRSPDARDAASGPVRTRGPCISTVPPRPARRSAARGSGG